MNYRQFTDLFRGFSHTRARPDWHREVVAVPTRDRAARLVGVCVVRHVLRTAYKYATDDTGRRQTVESTKVTMDTTCLYLIDREARAYRIFHKGVAGVLKALDVLGVPTVTLTDPASRPPVPLPEGFE